MPTVPELGARLNVPIEDMIRMGEQQVLNPASNVFRTIETMFAEKFAGLKASETKAAGKRAKTRVYIQHAVEPMGRYALVQAYPGFDIKFTGVDRRSGATAIANFTMIFEYMLAQFRVNKGMVIAYGVGLKQIVMRNRDWIHVCVPGHVASAQAAFLREDHAILAMVNSFRKKNYEPHVARAYIDRSIKIHCATPAKCAETASGGIMMLTHTDTNFRQLAFFMRQKQMRLLYFAIPGNKHMEFCTEGAFPELDAHVMPSDDGKYVSISYKNAPALDFTYLHSNYLELIARTSVVLEGCTYHKEFFSKVNGVLVYKITRIDRLFDEPPLVYRSWIEPDYKSMYMVYVPILKPNGSVSRAADWSIVGRPIEKVIVDDVVDYALRVQGAPNLAREIERRLHTKASNYVLSGQIMSSPGSVPVIFFDLLALAIYSHVFLRKYKDGVTVSTLAPHARELAMLARATPFALTTMYVGTIFGNILRQLSGVTSVVRKAYYDAIGANEVPLPSFAVCPGFVEYSDLSSSNPRFHGWGSFDDDPTYGFTNLLPGVSNVAFRNVPVPSEIATVMSVDDDEVAVLCAAGEGFVDSGKLRTSEHRSVVELACGVYTSITSLLDQQVDPERIVDEYRPAIPFHNPDVIPDHPVVKEVMYIDKPQPQPKLTQTPAVVNLVNKIVGAHNNLVSIGMDAYVERSLAFTQGVPEIVPGSIAHDPRQYFMDGLNVMFPGSLTMTTQHFESDRHHSSWDVAAKAVRMKLDVSKIENLRPESVFLPLMPGHVQPNVKNTFNTTFHTFVKRNANTPADADPLDEDFLWDRAWSALLKVFYVEDAEQQLESWPYVGPSRERVQEWVSKLDDAKKAKLDSQFEGFSFVELVNGAKHNHLMLKSKLKPALDSSYLTSVKYPQSIQFDPTGKSVAVFSPVITQKVHREQHILKPNVLVLQHKSIDDINRFINGFDWRPNKRGVRKYVEIDYTQFDKSQSRTIANFYLRKLAKFGVLEDYIKFIKQNQTSRTVAAMRAGIAAALDYQNPSGASFTLDRNNDTNEIAIAELLLEILDSIEFVIMMGDDILIAVRGDVDISMWESEVNRKFNLSMKAEIHDSGYICSMDIAHLPDGHSVVVPDVIKKTLSFMDQSVTDETLFHERHVSYMDTMKYVVDTRVQQFLSYAKYERMKKYLPTITPESIMCLFKAHAKLYLDEKAFRGMFALQSTTRFY